MAKWVWLGCDQQVTRVVLFCRFVLSIVSGVNSRGRVHWHNQYDHFCTRLAHDAAPFAMNDLIV